MTISIRPVEGSFADLVSGIDTTRPSSGEEVAAIARRGRRGGRAGPCPPRRTTLAGHAPTVDHV